MKETRVEVKRYDADEGMVFDYAEPQKDEEGNEIHLYAKTIFLGKNDSIDNYIEVPKQEEE